MVKSKKKARKVATPKANRLSGRPPWYDPERTKRMDAVLRQAIRQAPAKVLDAAEELLASLDGEGWKLDIWENLGWHYAVYNGPLTVHGSPGHWYCLLSRTEIRGGGALYWTDDAHFKNPNDAVRHQLDLVRKFTANCVAVQQHLETLVEP